MCLVFKDCVIKEKLIQLKVHCKRLIFLLKHFIFSPHWQIGFYSQWGLDWEHSGYETLFMCQVAKDKSDLGRLMKLFLTLPSPPYK